MSYRITSVVPEEVGDLHEILMGNSPVLPSPERSLTGPKGVARTRPGRAATETPPRRSELARSSATRTASRRTQTGGG